MRAAWSPALFSFLALACGSRGQGTMDSGVPDAGHVMQAEEACDRLAVARCSVSERCYPAFARLESATCSTIERQACLKDFQRLAPVVEDHRAQINEAKVLSCEQRLLTSVCPPSLPPRALLPGVAPFSDCEWNTGLMLGLVPSGQLCAQPEECAPGSVCIKQGGVCNGTCSSLPKEGEYCAFGCAPGLTCGDDERCVPLRELNDPCESSAQCQADLICAGFCRPRRKLGETCVIDQDRLSQCEPGLACDATPVGSRDLGTCILPRGVDEPCRFHWSCREGLMCLNMDWSGFPLSAPTSGVCRHSLAKTDECTPLEYAVYIGETCGVGLTCDAATVSCVTQPQLGDACDPGLQNCSGVDVFCNPGSGTCTGPAGLNDPCAFRLDDARSVSIPCAIGYCDVKGTKNCRAPDKPIGAACELDSQCVSGRCAVHEDRTTKCAMACD